MKEIYLKKNQPKAWETDFGLDTPYPTAIENFMHAIAYHRSPRITKDMYDKVRTLFYDLAVEDNLRMGFLKGITLALSNLEIRCETEAMLEERSDTILATLLKVVLFPVGSFFELAHDNPHLYAKPCADDILDTRLLKAFIKHCVPTLEELYYEFQNNLYMELSA